MSLTLQQTATAVGPGIGMDFYGVGGVEPYTYTVLPGGAGGSIDSNGHYTAPTSISEFSAAFAADTIQVYDADLVSANATVVVGPALFLVCDIVQKEMGLADGRVYLWDQKIDEPSDNDVFIAVSIVESKPFGNANAHVSVNGGGLDSDQSLAMRALIAFDIISRGSGARDRKEEIALALASDYSERQQNANSFQISKIPTGSGFMDLSGIDGAAIPYRFRTTFAMQYVFRKAKPANYFDTFADPTIVTNS